MQKPSSTCQYAIVGAGVSGLYSAWRLIRDGGVDPKTVAIFEGSDRIGGRLWSLTLKDEHAIPAELGGMFFSDAQELVYRLCTDVLKLKTHTVTPADDFAWLRNSRFNMADFAKPDVLPYHLAKDEQGLAPHQLLLLAVKRIAPDIMDVWPLNPDSSLTDTVQYLRSVEYEGRPLYAWGFWNLLSQVISNEARLCLADVEGTYALFANWNGYDACLAICFDLAGQWYRLPNGYQKLPQKIAAELRAAGVTFHMQHHVKGIHTEKNQSGGVMHFHEHPVHVEAEHIVLAIPKGALERIAWHRPESLKAVHNSSFGVAASKIFLVYDQPWWESVPDGPGHIPIGKFAASHTDLPMRQCFYLGTDPETGDGLLLASFGDGRAVQYWPPLMDRSGRGDALTTSLSLEAAADITRQLSEMHDYDVPAPTDGVYVDWSRPPYYGGWHAWLPGYCSWDASKTMRAAGGAPGITTCGEAYSAFQGWVEGALTSAEMMLQEHLGLTMPDWLADSDCLSPYQG